MRNDGRFKTQVRPIKLVPNYSKHAKGSVLVECGDTRILVTVNIEDGVPHWMRSQKANKGWLTAEYSMLPGSTHTRSKRERGHTGGRTQEIQRLIGRSLRAVIDLSKCPDMTFVVDCDVLQADGGTRTTAITGGYVALKLAVDKLLRENKLKHNPLTDAVAALSVGYKGTEVIVDLNYEEDASCDGDINIVFSQSGKIIEIQGTAEQVHMDPSLLPEIISTAKDALSSIFELQIAAAEGQEIEG
jgi:ribonuclease PH